MRTFLAAVTAATLSITFTTPAQAGFAACAGKDGSKLEKCEAKQIKNVEKRRANTTPYQPSDLDKSFASLDTEADNPFNSDHHYFGVKDTGFESLNDVAAAANKISATVRMANYVGDLNKTDPAAAAALGGKLLPILQSLQESINEVSEKAQAIDPNDLVSSPMELPKALSAIGGIISQLGGTAAKLPGALTAIGPIAKGAASAAVDKAVGDATSAVEDAVGTTKDKLKK